MKHLFLLMIVITTFLLSSCSKEKQTEKMLYGEWEVTSFLHGANDLTQFYKDSCGCRLVFTDYKLYGEKFEKCILKCPYNGWNYYYTDSLENIPWNRESFDRTTFYISSDGSKIEWYFGKTQPNNIYRWGMYPLTIRINSSGGQVRNIFLIEEISKEKLTFMFTDSINETYSIHLSKIKE
jgi:hypothetical protein